MRIGIALDYSGGFHEAVDRVVELEKAGIASKMAARFKAKIDTPHGLRRCFEANVERAGRQPLVSRFGGIPLKRHKNVVLTDRVSIGPVYPNKELIRRLQKGRCELCQRADSISVHHVRSLATLVKPGWPQPEWAQVMAKRRRKSLVVCGDCHDLLASLGNPGHAHPRVPGGGHRRADTTPTVLITLTVNEFRRLFDALLLRPLHSLADVLAWSTWRRKHQARARACHHRKHHQQQ